MQTNIHGVAVSGDFERACLAMASGPEWLAFLDRRFGAGTWVIAEYLTEAHRSAGKTVAITSSWSQDNALATLAAEPGYERLKAEAAKIEAARALPSNASL